ncbi:MAG: heme o synthase [Gemmatimonadetes bacterium]|nr:heme o synthase [Gemmatimonadota bacterium]
MKLPAVRRPGRSYIAPMQTLERAAGAATEDRPPAGASVTWRCRGAALLELTKPGITRLVLVTAAAGFYLAQAGGFDFVRFVHALLGIGLAAGGANALNMVVERDADRLMRRTAGRPLPSGRLTRDQALVFAIALVGLGLLQLLLFVNPTTTLVVASSVLSYVLIYTPLKRVTWSATLVGAIPGALPILAGWTAGGGSLDAGGLALFGIVFLWQMPHFFALAWIYRDDYLRGGFRMLSARDPAGARTARQIVLWTAALIVVSLLPATVGLAGRSYLFAAALLGLAFLATGASLLAGRSVQRARRVFLASVVYLPLLLGALVIDKAIS